MLDRSMSLQGVPFDDAGTGAITVMLGDTPRMDGQNGCLEKCAFWRNGRLWASSLRAIAHTPNRPRNKATRIMMIT